MTSDAPAELEETWKDLLQRHEQLRTDAKLAGLALGLVREMGNATRHRDVLRELCGAWAHDWRLSMAAASMLVEQAGRRGMDEPPLSDDGPAWWAAAALEGALRELSENDRKDPEIAGNLEAMLGNALRLCGPSRDAEAQEAFTRAIELDPDRGEWWYDAGLLDKWRGRFDEGFRANELARMHMGPEKPVLWNLAICATALGKAEEAVAAWHELGVEARVDHSRSMPYVAELPPLLVRVLSRTPATDATSQLPDKAVGFELVWVAPLSPCHGVVQSPTFREAPIDYGDLVLWDGAPVAAHQTLSGETVPVFPLLEILRHGSERRFPFVALEREPGAMEGLEEELPEGTRVFIRQERVAHACAACEAGEPHEHHDDRGAGAETAAASESGSVAETAAATESVPGAETAAATESGSVAESGSGSESVAASVSVPESVPGALRLVRGKVIVPPFQKLDEFRDSWDAAMTSRAATAAIPALFEQLKDSKRAGQEHQAWRGIEGKALRQKARA